MQKALIITLIILLGLSSAGATDCDLNQDGYYYSISDYLYLLNTLNYYDGETSFCEIECDLDEDGLYFTVADMMLYTYHLLNPDSVIEYSQHPDMDTLKIEYVFGNPGESIIIPVNLITVDTSCAFEFSVVANPQYITFYNFILTDDLAGTISYFADGIHVAFFDVAHSSFPVTFPPGTHNLGYIEVNLTDDVVCPDIVDICFRSCPEDNFHSGLANMRFLQPVLLNGGIITSTGIDNEPNIPNDFTMEAYPNPFNSSVNIVVNSKQADIVSIYDLLGRKVRTFDIAPGISSINWDGTDGDGNSVSAGLFFARPENNHTISAKKLLLIK